MLFVEISKTFPSLDGNLFLHYSHLETKGVTLPIRSITFLYAAEILIRGLKSIGPPKWKLPDGQARGLLQSLEAHLQKGFELATKNLRAYECHLSGQDDKIQKLENLPGLLGFARAAERGLPCHLIVATHRHVPTYASLDPYSFYPFLLLLTQHTRYSIFDLFASSSNQKASAFLDGSWIPRHQYSAILVSEHNSKLMPKVSTSNIKYETHDETDCTNTSIGYHHTETRKNLELANHPDPPRFYSTDHSTLSLAGLHLHERRSDAASADWLYQDEISLSGQCNPDGQPHLELQLWDYRPTGRTVPRRKRKQGERDVGNDSSADDLHSSKRHGNISNIWPMNMQMYITGYRNGAKLPKSLIDGCEEYMKKLRN